MVHIWLQEGVDGKVVMVVPNMRMWPQLALNHLTTWTSIFTCPGTSNLTSRQDDSYELCYRLWFNLGLIFYHRQLLRLTTPTHDNMHSWAQAAAAHHTRQMRLVPRKVKVHVCCGGSLCRGTTTIRLGGLTLTQNCPETLLVWDASTTAAHPNAKRRRRSFRTVHRHCWFGMPAQLPRIRMQKGTDVDAHCI
jgi:hypothetical protein